MAVIKVKFRPSAVAGKEGSVYYSIIHARKVRSITAGYKVMPEEWNDVAAVVEVRRLIAADMERMARVVRRLDKTGVPYTVDDVVSDYAKSTAECSVFNYMSVLIERMRQNGRVRTAETYTAALNSLMRFRQGKDFALDSLSSDLMESYQAWHRSRGNSYNTISFYNRIVRAVYNRAVENGMIENKNPFRRVYTGIAKTVKRALPIDTLSRIRVLDLSECPALDYARDMFIMSFMLRGMSFIDMAYLKKSDVRGGYVVYRRRKTGQTLRIRWTQEMEDVLGRYPENKSDYLLPIIRNKGVNERCVYRNAAYNINRSLKIIGTKVGVAEPLTLYVARHSWASAAKTKGVPLIIISEGMGHHSEATTRIYLSSLSSSVIDSANSLIISSI